MVKKKLFLGTLLSIAVVAYSADKEVSPATLDFELNFDYAKNMPIATGLSIGLSTFLSGHQLIANIYKGLPGSSEEIVSSCVESFLSKGSLVSKSTLTEYSKTVISEVSQYNTSLIIQTSLYGLLIASSVLLGKYVVGPYSERSHKDIWDSRCKMIRVKCALDLLSSGNNFSIKLDGNNRIIVDKKEIDARCYRSPGSNEYYLDRDIEYLNKVSNSWTALFTHGPGNIAKINVFLEQAAQLDAAKSVRNIKPVIAKK